MADAGNLYSATPGHLLEELVEVLGGGGDTRVERIVSRGHRSPPGFWYDQPLEELVLLLQGRARLSLADPDEEVELDPGDWLRIRARRRHRVEATDPQGDTVWLAVHYPDPAP